MNEQQKKQIIQKAAETFGDTVSRNRVFSFAGHYDILDTSLEGALHKKIEDMLVAFVEVSYIGEGEFITNFVTEDRAKESGLSFDDLLVMSHENIAKDKSLTCSDIKRIGNKENGQEINLEQHCKMPIRLVTGDFFCSGIILYEDILKKYIFENGAYLICGSCNRMYFIPKEFPKEFCKALLNLFNNEWKTSMKQKGYSFNLVECPVSDKVYEVSPDGSIKPL